MYRIAITILVACVVLLTARPAAADFDEALAAYKAKDFERARALIAPLAERGDRSAQLIMGSLYEHGRGVEKDLVEAHKWFVLASERQLAAGARRARAVRAHLSRPDVDESTQRVQAWKAAFARRASPPATDERGDITQFRRQANMRTENHPPNESLRILCRAKVDRTHVTFITADRKTVLLVTLTPIPLVDPTKDLGIDMEHAIRFGMPRLRPGRPTPPGPMTIEFLDITDTDRKTATMDWAYVYDRNGDDFVDYFTHVSGIMPTLPDPRPDGIPPMNVGPVVRESSISSDQIMFIADHMQLQFAHAADDDFDGRADGFVIGTQELKSGWVDGQVVIRSTRFNDDYDACVYEPGMTGIAPATCRFGAGGYRVPGRFFTGFNRVPPGPEIRFLARINAAARKCGLTARHFRRE